MNRFILLLFALILLLYNSEGKDLEYNYRHQTGAFMGGISLINTHNLGLSYGLNYEYKFAKNKVGVGFMAEMSNAPEFYAFALPVYFHLLGNFKVYLAPGWTLSYMEDRYVNPIIEEKEPHQTTQRSNFLLRVGFGYDFNFNKIQLTPSINSDINSYYISLVYGISLGIRF